MSPTSAEHPGHPPLVGREGEIRVVEELVGRLPAEGPVLIFSGVAGVGKSILLDFAERAASAQGVKVLRAGGVEFEAEVSFIGLNQLLLPLQERIGELPAHYRDGLLASLGLGSGPAANRLLVCNAALALLSDAAREEPILLLVDDLPWIDRASAGVLEFLVRRLTGRGLGFIGALRLEEPGFFVRHGLPDHLLGPLEPAAAHALMRERFPNLAGSVRRRLVAESEGNPLVMLEIAAGLNASQQGAFGRLPPVLSRGGPPNSLFASRVGELPRATRDLLLVAVLDGSGDLRRLQAAAPGPGALDRLEPAERARLVVVDESAHRLAFRHPLIRSAVIDLSTSTERRRTHRVLSEHSADRSDRRAWHLAEATVEPDEPVASLLQEAAREVLHRGDAVGAVRALIHAADLSPTPADRSRRLAEAAYIGADVTGELRNASLLLEDARNEDANSQRSLQVSVAAAYVLLNSDGDVESAHRLLVAAIEVEINRGDPRQATFVEALHTLLMTSFYMGRADGWEHLFGLLEAIGPRIPDSLRFRAAIYPDPTQVPRPTLIELDRAIAGLDEETDPAQIIKLGLASIYVDRLPACESAMWRVVEDGRSGGAIASSINALMMLGFADYHRGRWDSAHRRLEEGLELCESQGYRLLGWEERLGEGLIAAARGDAETARSYATEMTDWAAPRGVGAIEDYAAHVRTVAALSGGEFEDAFRQASAISPAGTLSGSRAHALWVAFDLVEAAVRCGRRAEAQAHVEAMRDADLATLSPRLALLLAGAEALVAPGEESQALYERALALPGAADWKFDLARVRLAFGESLRRNRAGRLARRHLAVAREAFESLGATPWAARSEIELRATAARKSRRADPEARLLTPQELEIASLAASGLTNKEIGGRLFLSHRTVSAHLYRVFPKLEITSRAMLRDALSALPESLEDEPPS